MTVEELIEELSEEFNIDPKKAETEIINPPFEIYDKVHNWRNYIPRYLQLNWSKLSKQTKIALWFVCEDRANNEQWD